VAGGFELAGHERDAGRLAAERLAELRLDHRAGPGELEQERLLAGVQAEWGQQSRGPGPVAQAQQADGLVEGVGVLEVHGLSLTH
jgi:hypothetical protein